MLQSFGTEHTSLLWPANVPERFYFIHLFRPKNGLFKAAVSNTANTPAEVRGQDGR
jgi:hypothetical protein